MSVLPLSRCLCLLILCLPVVVAMADTRVAAASSLQFAMPALQRAFESAYGHRLRVSFGSSGNFRHQIERGAPFELFLSANDAYARALEAQGLTRGKGQIYALGQLALYIPSSSSLPGDTALKGLSEWLHQSRPLRFAIANPEHAPYGQAAREILVARKLWTLIRPHLVLGENAAQAASFAASGSAAGGLLPMSLSAAVELQQRGRFVAMPVAWHQPLRHRMVLLNTAGDGASAFFSFMQGADARRILSAHGFLPPEGDDGQ